ncbi:hypothetical protein DPEC_G00235690 [Dallia pectoralis]|uniref:Uncharacterized protein n=1 Tax=Dallia pectoralis TaxID=75939 RepID=A0ACC2FYK0_DALPE|nr:hypothetical protein DPEC_G00235690 [Dallia pectoralis]
MWSHMLVGGPRDSARIDSPAMNEGRRRAESALLCHPVAVSGRLLRGYVSKLADRRVTGYLGSEQRCCSCLRVVVRRPSGRLGFLSALYVAGTGASSSGATLQPWVHVLTHSLSEDLCLDRTADPQMLSATFYGNGLHW